jgi:nucleotide-binding universal stress UspA family protein
MGPCVSCADACVVEVADALPMTALSEPHPEPPFKSIACAVDGSAAALEGVRQAARLAGPGTTIELIAVANEWGGGPLLPKARAQAALAEAEAVLAGGPAQVRARMLLGDAPWRLLLREAPGHDLLVLGRNRASRAGGIAMGSAASHAVHSSPIPVLLATAPPAGVGFPDRIVVGSEGPGSSAEAVRLASRIAHYAGRGLTLVGAEKSAHEHIVEAAKRETASLVIVGSRRLRGVSALRSVSERVAHEAPCSVIVVRDGMHEQG